jgi:type IX secretion system PorP/SprF family membrane protein
MKRNLLLWVLLATTVLSYAQQDPQYSHFFLNRLNYNPAFAGTEEKICALGIYRTQWIGFGGTGNNQLGVAQGETPQTFLVSINAPIKNKFGVGLNIYRDQQGFESTINPMLSLSYIHTFANSSKLSGGLGVGFIQKTQNGGQLVAREQGDAIIPTGNVTGNALDLNFGLYYTMPSLWRFDNFYTGFSMTHINQGNPKYELPNGIVDNSMAIHYYFMTGATYTLNGSLDLEPNIIVKRDQAKFSTEINTMVMYNNKFRAGLAYRTEDAVSILLGFKFSPVLQMGYSYDLTTSNIIEYSSGSHEILLKYCFMPVIKTKEKIVVPRLTPRFL